MKQKNQALKIKNLKGLVCLLAVGFLFAIFSSFPQRAVAQSASFYVSPAKGSYKVGATFSVNVLVSVDGIAINAAQATISFPPDKLKVVQISKAGSIFNLWVEEPVFLNSSGKISFLGGVPSPGYIGKGGKVISILFKAQSAGQATVSFGGEKILANDPYGTNIFAGSSGGNYTAVLTEEYIPPEKPIEKPPSEEPEELAAEDTEPPDDFEIIIDNEGDSTNPTPLLYFETKDDFSGISHYEAIIGKEVFEIKPGESFPWRLPKLSPDTYQIIVKAVDKAGNSKEASTEIKIESIAIPKITTCPGTFRPGEEMLFISGTALPNSKVIIFFEKDGELIKKWEITSDGEGDWSLAKEDLFRSGIYKITARTEDSRGAISDPSEPCSVKVILGGISIGPLIVSYKNFTSIGLIIFFTLLALIIFLVWRIRKTQALIRRETKDLKTKFYKEYNELRADIEKKLMKSRKIRDIRPASDKEKKEEEQLLQDLIDVEKVLREELKDIEEIT